MALPYFFIETLSQQDAIILPEETSRHCIQVLRMKAGEQLQLTDGKGNLFTVRISKPDKKNCVVAVEEKTLIPPHIKKVSIGISLLKNANRFEWFLEKATEMGIGEIIPLTCKRTERQHFRFERMHNILVAAMLQSQQAWLPLLHEPQPVEKVISLSAYAQTLIAHCEETNKEPISNIGEGNEIQILIGPEGDFTPEEIELALQHHFQPVSLGGTRLRTETAGIVAAALLMNHRG
ncbi:MAG TPA: RsmE family RNA methyltransferase [Panacibacter sp.]|nr:RsmE family RNA methyltransferase [Panacibacter sp.]